MARLDAIRAAVRPRLHGRAMLAGPAGAGKTWTALSIATVLDKEQRGCLTIDTEKESALTYADVFQRRAADGGEWWSHLPWRPPYDPDELTECLAVLGDRYGVVVIDSLTHFWRGIGGTLDQAGGKFGGWKEARPMQERMVEAILAMPCHVIVCVRSKMGYLLTEGGHKVEQVGMDPMQDDVLPYEVNVVAELDKTHNLVVTKSRSPAVPVGRMYPPGTERKFAQDYSDWLDGGVPPASRDDVQAVTDAFAEVTDADERKALKRMFVEQFGQPPSLTADKVPDARAWVARHVLGLDQPPAPPTVPVCAVEGCDGLDVGVGLCAAHATAEVEAALTEHFVPVDGDEPDEPVKPTRARK